MVTRAGMDMSDTHWACRHTDTGVGVQQNGVDGACLVWCAPEGAVWA